MDPAIARSQWAATGVDSGDMNIRYLHVFGSKDKGALLVAVDDNVYGVGYNGDFSLLTFHHESRIIIFETLIRSLSQQKVTRISVGRCVGAAITADGRIFHWGRNLKASYEMEDRDNVAAVYGVHQPGGSNLGNFVDVACGDMFVAALTNQGQVILWGSIHERAQIVYGHIFSVSQIKAFSCGVKHIAMLCAWGNVFTCGFGSNGQLGREWNPGERYLEAKPVTLKHGCTRVVQVACGTHSTLFLMENGSLWATGMSNNEFHHLGFQTIEVVYNEVVLFPERVFINEKVKQIAATNCKPSIYAAATECGHIFTWGKAKYPWKIRNESKLISAFYGESIPPNLGDVIQQLPLSGNAAVVSSITPNQPSAIGTDQPSSSRPAAPAQANPPSFFRPGAPAQQSARRLATLALPFTSSPAASALRDRSFIIRPDASVWEMSFLLNTSASARGDLSSIIIPAAAAWGNPPSIIRQNMAAEPFASRQATPTQSFSSRPDASALQDPQSTIRPVNLAQPSTNRPPAPHQPSTIRATPAQNRLALLRKPFPSRPDASALQDPPSINRPVYQAQPSTIRPPAPPQPSTIRATPAQNRQALLRKLFSGIPDASARQDLPSTIRPATLNQPSTSRPPAPPQPSNRQATPAQSNGSRLPVPPWSSTKMQATLNSPGQSSVTRRDSATHLVPSTECGANVMESAIITDLTELQTEIGNLIKIVSPLLKGSNSK